MFKAKRILTYNWSDKNDSTKTPDEGDPAVQDAAASRHVHRIIERHVDHHQDPRSQIDILGKEWVQAVDGVQKQLPHERTWSQVHYPDLPPQRLRRWAHMPGHPEQSVESDLRDRSHTNINSELAMRPQPRLPGQRRGRQAVSEQSQIVRKAKQSAPPAWTCREPGCKHIMILCGEL